MSPSSRRAWIEIVGIGTVKQSLPVALLAEGVDRNNGYIIRCKIFFVVALLAEGVDRNLLCHRYLLAPEMSPSSRRAWIEIRPTPSQREIHPSRPPRGGRG